MKSDAYALPIHRRFSYRSRVNFCTLHFRILPLPTMHRPTAGWLAILLSAAGAVLVFGNFGRTELESFGGACLHIGILLGLLWLAEPQLRTLPAWLVVGVIASAVVLVVRPRLFPVVFVIMLAMWFLYPRKAREEVTWT